MTARIAASRHHVKQIKVMKEPCSGYVPSLNSEDAGAVNRPPDPEWILALVDLIFLGQEEGRVVPS